MRGSCKKDVQLMKKNPKAGDICCLECTLRQAGGFGVITKPDGTKIAFFLKDAQASVPEKSHAGGRR